MSVSSRVKFEIRVAVPAQTTHTQHERSYKRPCSNEKHAPLMTHQAAPRWTC